MASFLPVLEGHETEVGDLPARPFDALAAVVLVLECLPLAVRRRWPGVCLALVSAGFVGAEIGSYHMVAGSGLSVALLSAGAHLERHRRAAVVVLSVAYAGLVAVLVRLGAPEEPGGFVTFYVALGVVWGAGAWLRSTRTAEAERRRRVAEATRAAERTRIARELHDVVTHHVTAMVVQTEAARYLTAVPERLEETLGAVTDAGRRAITDLRYLLDLLNPDHGTEPGTDTGSGTDTEPGIESGAPSAGDLHVLVERVRRAGQPVEFIPEGEPQPVGDAGFTAYRVVQEALTNALKYAHGSRTVVRAHYGEREITVEVGTDGSGSWTGSAGGSGRGLAGLGQRVDALGGEFSADRRADGGFVVRARIPAGSVSWTPRSGFWSAMTRH